MDFSIREYTGKDTEYFVAAEFAAAKENGLIEKDKPEKEFRKELLESVDEKKKTGIFVVESDAGEYAGLLWVSDREGGELWDFEENPAWIYDIRVRPEYRGQGLGRKLLLQAEDWAKKEGFSRCGLHVFAFNHHAIRLYYSAGYTMKNCYLQKEVTLHTMVKTVTPFHIKRMETGQDESNVIALGYQNFRELARSGGDIPEEDICNRYNKSVNRTYFKNPKHCVYIGEDAGECAGFVWGYISQGDIGGKRYVWMLDLEVAQKFRQQKLGTQLLAQVEQWTIRQGLDTVRTGVHAKNEIALHLLRSTGYKETNLFLEKSL
jgi:ribosomal protein S18 acetylase RimI-like enzyme